MIKYAIFDFDGTLVNSKQLLIDVYTKHIQKPARLPILTEKALSELPDMTAKEIMKKYIAWWKLPLIVYLWAKHSYEEIPNLKAFAGIGDLIENLHLKGVKMYILSSNSTKNINYFLEINGWEKYFEHVHNASLSSKSKALNKLLGKIAKENEGSLESIKKEAIYVGDEAKDIHASQDCQIPVVSVGWGFNNSKFLQSLKPDYFVESVEGLEGVLGIS
jgi:HAD superfamily hydrolase (TIGR01549 family)